MPLQFQNVDVLLGGLSQKQSPLTKAPGSLELAVNVEFDKQGRLNKRRGYQRVPFNVVNPHSAIDDLDDIAVALALRRHELLVVTHSYVLSVGSSASELRGTDSMVFRGPNNRGNGRIMYGATSRMARREIE